MRHRAWTASQANALVPNSFAAAQMSLGEALDRATTGAIVKAFKIDKRRRQIRKMRRAGSLTRRQAKALS